jgi:hypothetical protein
LQISVAGGVRVTTSSPAGATEKEKLRGIPPWFNCAATMNGKKATGTVISIIKYLKGIFIYLLSD